MRRLREAKGIKQETIAHLTKVSPAQVSRIEAGKKRATRPFVEIIDDHLEAGGALIALWEDLNKDGHPVPVWFDWPQREGDAVMLVCWEHGVIPGLLQTPDYMSVLLKGNQEAIDLRLRRQSILTRDDGTPPHALCAAARRARPLPASRYRRDDEGPTGAPAHHGHVAEHHDPSSLGKR